MVRGDSERKGYDMKKIYISLILILIFFNNSLNAKNDLYEKIDLFGEVIENIKKDYVDDVNQSEMMDSYQRFFTIPRSLFCLYES